MKHEKKSGLGTGVSQLFGNISEEETATSTLPLIHVQPSSNQPRKHFDPDSILELAESILLYGIIQPLTVRRLDSGYYEIVAGERRWRAAKEAGLEEVPVMIIEADQQKVMELGLIENLQREDLNPVEEAQGFQVLVSEYGLTQEDVADRMGKSRPAIANALRLLQLPGEVLCFVEEGRLSAGHARTLLSAPSEALMVELAEEVMAGDWSVRRLEQTIKAMKQALAKGEEPEKPEDETMIYVRASQDSLCRALGRRVQIQHKGNKGKIVLEYTDTHDLTDLVEVLSALEEGNYGEGE